jgi:hypothetical protein
MTISESLSCSQRTGDTLGSYGRIASSLWPVDCHWRQLAPPSKSLVEPSSRSALLRCKCPHLVGPTGELRNRSEEASV